MESGFDLLVERKEAIADAMTREMGKVLAETRADVQEGIDTAYYAATEGRRLFGHVVPSIFWATPQKLEAVTTTHCAAPSSRTVS